MNIKEGFELFAKPVRQFLSTIEYSQALITGGLIRDLVLSYPVNDTDVIIKSDLTNEQLASMESDTYQVYLNYGPDTGHFASCFRFLIKDVVNNIDYLFVHDYLSLSTVVDSFDCSLNKGYGCPTSGAIIPPNLDVFTYVGTDKERFSRFSNMYHRYMMYHRHMESK